MDSPVVVRSLECSLAHTGQVIVVTEDAAIFGQNGKFVLDKLKVAQTLRGQFIPHARR